jgi:hypothetical protein
MCMWLPLFLWAHHYRAVEFLGRTLTKTLLTRGWFPQDAVAGLPGSNAGWGPAVKGSPLPYRQLRRRL